jgi:predicted alpha/beta-fold hydrolase
VSALDALAGHFWTIAPVLAHLARPALALGAPWSCRLSDPGLGEIALRGVFRDVPGSDAAVIVVHGLGGTTQTHYCVAAARAAEALGLSCLRLALRGAERDGEDFYHAGLFADVDAAVASPELARFARLYVLGFSLGGHVTLRFAFQRAAERGEPARDPRVRGVAAICAPLDLERGAQHIDSVQGLVYRQHVLSGLKAMYAAMAARRAVPTPLAEVLAVRTIRRWDALTVVPRHGFGSVDDYYAEASAGPSLRRLELPALLVQHAQDPMVPAWTYRDHLEHARGRVPLEVKWLPAGGHVGYPSGVDLGESGPRGVEAQALSWLLQRG